MNASQDHQLSSLAYYHGPEIFLNLRPIEGGAFAAEVSRLRSWAEGRPVSLADFRSLLDRFEEVLTDPHQDLEKELQKPAGFRRSAFQLRSEILRSLGEGYQIDHEMRVFEVNGISVDPLLDPLPIPEVFEFLEQSVEGGDRLEVPSLGIAAYGVQGIEVRQLSDLYRLVASQDIAAYFLERILYLIPRSRIPHDMLEKISETKRQGLILEAEPIRVRPGVLEEPSPPIASVPWNDPGLLGDLDLATVGPEVEGRWIRGEGIPSMDPFAELPLLRDWLVRHREMIHWSDVQKLRAEVNWAWAEGARGSITAGQREGLQKRIQGILGEIVHRREIVERYARDYERDPETVLLMEGEIRTADNKLTSDALIGRIDVPSRTFLLSRIYEVTTNENLLQESERQQEENLRRRFPEKGLVIRNEAGRWGRVDVAWEGVERRLMASDEGEGWSRAAEAGEIVEEILGWTVLRRYRSQVIPLEERRRYQGVQGVSAFGRLVSWIWDSLWEEWGRLRQTSPLYDLRWLELQLQARLPHLPAEGRVLLEIRLGCLRNLSPELNPTGERISAYTLFPQRRVNHRSVLRYQREIEERLGQMSLPILQAPREENNKAIAAGHTLRKFLEEIWEGKQTVSEVDQALQGRIDTAEGESKKQLQTYQAALRNMSPELNAGGARISANALGIQVKAHGITIAKHQREIGERLKSMGLSILSDPEKGSARDVGRSMQMIREGIWEGKTKVSEVDEALRDQIDAAEGELKKQLHAYQAVLRNMSWELNPRGSRIAATTLAAQWGVSQSTIANNQQKIEERLKAMNLPILADPGAKKGKAIAAGHLARKAFNEIWEGKAQASEVDQALQGEIDRTEGEVKKQLQAYQASLRNVSEDLNSGKERVSAAFLASQSEMGGPSITRYQREIEGQLRARDLPILPDPGEKFVRTIAAGHSTRKILEMVWEGKRKASEVDQALQGEIDRADGEVKKQLQAYQAALRNVSEELNSEGRMTLVSLASRWGVSWTTIRNYQRKIEEKLAGR